MREHQGARRAALVVALGLAVASAGCEEDTQYQGPAVEADAQEQDLPGDVGQEDVAPDVVEDMGGGVVDIPVITEDMAPEEVFEPACSFEDPLAPNQSPAQASALEGTYYNDALYLCPGAADWFAVQGEAGRELIFFVDFNPRMADVDIYLYREGAAARREQAVAASDSPNRDETIRYTPSESGRYLLEVSGFEGVETSYALFVATTCAVDADCGGQGVCYLAGGYCVPDAAATCGINADLEPNESARDASPLTLPASLAGVNICTSDEDYYQLTVSAGSGVEVELDYGAGAEIEVFLYNDQGQLVGQGAEVRGGKRLVAPSLRAGRYTLLVDQQGEQNPAVYALEARLLQGACASDLDCVGVTAREFCELATGACVGIAGEGALGLGERCDDDGDCDPATTNGCYEGTPGGGDNLCTLTCADDGPCGALGEGAYCLVLDRVSDFGVCVPPCLSDFDCSSDRYCDAGSKTCLSRACGVDADCPREGEACLNGDEGPPFGRQGQCGVSLGEATLGCGVGEGLDAADNSSSGRAALVALNEDGSAFVEGLRACDQDEDWYVIELTGESSNLTVDVGFQGRADMDVYLLGEDGRTYGQGASPEGNPEQAAGRFLPAGRYFVRVNKFPSEGGAAEVTYNLSVNVGATDCRPLEGACDGVAPLRLVCDEVTGSCLDFAGEGAVALGGACDTDDDCGAGAEICWTFQGAGQGQNICTHFCQSQQACGDVPGTQCVAIRRNAGVCIQGQ